MDFVEYLKKSDVSENSKVYYNSMKWTSWKVLVVKVDGMHNILKSASHCLLVKRWRWKWMIKIFAGVCPWMSIMNVHYAAALLRGRLHLVRDTAGESLIL